MALSHSFGVECPNGDSRVLEVDIKPLELENLATSHTTIKGTDKDGFKVSAPALASPKQSCLFPSRKDALALAFVCDADYRFTPVERVFAQPFLFNGEVEHPTKQGELSIDASDSPLSARLSAFFAWLLWCLQTLRFEVCYVTNCYIAQAMFSEVVSKNLEQESL
jgi:hypothetical protein